MKGYENKRTKSFTAFNGTILLVEKYSSVSVSGISKVDIYKRDLDCKPLNDLTLKKSLTDLKEEAYRGINKFYFIRERLSELK